MKERKKPIHKSLILGSTVFIAFLCFLLSIGAYFTYSKSLYKRYDDKLNNEVESLSKAILQMSQDMRTYVQGLLEAEAIARTAKEQAEDMTHLAFTDALTHVNSKVAYDMSEYRKDDSVDDVFKRADESMYRKKMEIKGTQKSNS